MKKRIPFAFNAQYTLPGKTGAELCSVPYLPGYVACLKGFTLQAQPVSDTGQFVWLTAAQLQFWLDTSTSDVTTLTQSFSDGCVSGEPPQLVSGANQPIEQFNLAVSGQNAVPVNLSLNVWGWYDPAE